MKFRSLVIGVGAAGNKATINLINKSIVAREDTILLNSTLKDIPSEYRDSAIEIEGPDGCGQERSLAKNIILQAMTDKKIDLKTMINPGYDKVIIIASLCGATGSGMSPVIGGYIYKVLHIQVEIIGFVGFEDDTARAMRNIIEFCQDLNPNFSIQLIRNQAFLKEAYNNRIEAERLANDEVARRISIMLGNYMIDSNQNIDDTDLKKLNNTNGYKTIEYIEINDKIRNIEQYNEIIKDMLDNTKSIEPEGNTINRLGIIMNIQESSAKYIDGSNSLIRNRLGEPYEQYIHIQYSKAYPEFIAIMTVGMKMPEEHIKEYYQKYKDMTEAVNKNKDNFFNDIMKLSGDIEDNQFDAYSTYYDASPNDTVDNDETQFFASFESKDIINDNINDESFNKNLEF